MPVRIFIHGLESSNRGTKSVYFREKYPGMIIPTFAGNLQERMKQLRKALAGKTDIRLVGSKTCLYSHLVTGIDKVYLG